MDDSVAAIQHRRDSDGSLNVLDSLDNTSAHGRIRRTIELQISSQERGNSWEERNVVAKTRREL